MSKLVIYTADNLKFELEGTNKSISSRYDPDVHGEAGALEKSHIAVTKHFENPINYEPELKSFVNNLEGHDIIKVEWLADENLLTTIEGAIGYNWFLHEAPGLQEVVTFIPK